MTPYTSIQLRIKILSLASEAKHIRRWEARLKRAARHHPPALDTFWSLRDHRTGVVSEEARNTLLAYGFLRGLPYKAMEPKRYSNPNWTAIETMAMRYFGPGPSFSSVEFTAWKAAAGEPDKRHPSNNPPAAAPAAIAPIPPSPESPPAKPARKKLLGIF